MREPIDERDELPVDEPDYPSSVRLAGVIWICFGSLILLGAASNLLLLSGNRGGDAAGQTGGMVGVVFVAFFGAVFLHVGVQSTRGTAKDTLGNGVSSIIFG